MHGNDPLGGVRNLADRASCLQDEIANLETALDQKKREYRTITERDLPEMIEELGLTEVPFSDGLLVRIKDDVVGSLPKDPRKRERALAWLDEHGYGAVVKRTISVRFGRGEDEQAQECAQELRSKRLPVEEAVKVEHQTLRALARECLREGEEIPLEDLGLVRLVKASVTRTAE